MRTRQKRSARARDQNHRIEPAGEPAVHRRVPRRGRRRARAHRRGQPRARGRLASARLRDHRAPPAVRRRGARSLRRTVCRSGPRATSAAPTPFSSRRRASPRSSWSKAALDPVCSLTRVAHGSQSTLVVGPCAAARRRPTRFARPFCSPHGAAARLSSVGDTDGWSDLVDAEAAADGRGIEVRHRSFSEALTAFRAGRAARPGRRRRASCTARSATLSQRSSGTVDLACRGWLSDTSPGPVRPRGCRRSDGRRLRRRRSGGHAAGRFAASGDGTARARGREDARAGGRRRTERNRRVVARCDDENIYRRGDRATAGKPYRCRTR